MLISSGPLSKDAVEGGGGNSLAFHALNIGFRQLGQLLWPVLTIGEIHSNMHLEPKRWPHDNVTGISGDLPER